METNETIWTRLPDKDARRLRHLFTVVCPPVMFPSLEIHAGDWKAWSNEKMRNEIMRSSEKQFNQMKENILSPDRYLYPGLAEKKELYGLIDRHGIKFQEIHLTWRRLWVEQRKRHDEYRRKPRPEGRDNKSVIVGSGGSNRNKIRYPKKARKTAWKRFYKLFPHLDPKNEKKQL